MHSSKKILNDKKLIAGIAHLLSPLRGDHRDHEVGRVRGS